MLQKGNRVQVSKVVRWQFKMDTEQVLKVSVHVVDVFNGWETFLRENGQRWTHNACEVDGGATARQRTKPHRLRYGSGT
jgi:hypothetical protein